MSALRLTSLGRSSRGSSTPHTFRSTPKVNNFRSFRYTPNVTTRIASPQRILEKATNNNLQTVKPSNLMTPKFYVSRPAQFHTTKLLKQDAKEQRAENGNGNHTTEETNQKTQDQTQSSDPKDAKIVELQNQIEEYKMKLQYSLAERENLRRIRDSDVQKATDYGIQGFAKQVLDVADNLGRCISSVPKENLDEKTTTLLEGVTMTEKELGKILTKNGIEKFDPLGEKFDPNRMNAIMEMPSSPGREPGTVGMVLKPGYALKGRIIRPADVAVVKSA